MYPVSPWVGTSIKSMSEISFWERKRKFPSGNGSDVAVSCKLFASKYVIQLLGLEFLIF